MLNTDAALRGFLVHPTSHPVNGLIPLLLLEWLGNGTTAVLRLHTEYIAVFMDVKNITIEYSIFLFIKVKFKVK